MADEVMFGEPSTWNMKVGEFIETQLPQEKPQELLDLQEQNRKQRLLDSLQKIGPGLMDESLDFIRRKELKYGGTFKDYINREDKYEDLSFEEWLREDKAEGGRIGFEKGNPFPITDEVLKEIDDLIKDTNLDLKSIGKQIGYGTDKTQLKIDAPVMKAYIEKYGKPKPGRLKPANLAKDPEYVKFVVDKVKELGSKRAAEKELGITRKTINNILKQKAPELMKPANIPGPETGAKAVKKRAEAAIKEAKKKAGAKTTAQADMVINKILDKNKEYAAMSADNLAQDKNFLNRLRLRINTKTGDVDFTGYTEANPVRGKVFNDVELAQHAIDKAKKGELIVPDHITPKAKRKQNVGYPINFQPATYMENSQFENARKFLTDNPDVDAAPIDNYLKSNVQTIRFDNKKFGYDGNIVFDSEKGTQTLVDKPGLEAGRLKDPESGSKGSFGGKELAKGVVKTLQSLGTPLGVVAGETLLPGGVRSQLQEEGLEKTLRNPLSYLGLPLANIGAEAVKNPALQRILNLGLPIKAIRAGTPIGLGLMGISGLVDSALKFQEEFDALSPEEQKKYLEEQEEFGADVQGAAEGGIMRLGFADGPKKKGLKSPARRKFMKDTGKLAGILALIPYLGKFLAPIAKSPAAVEGVKLGFDNFLKLVAKIKAFGKEDPARTTLERQKATTYTGKDGSEYELVEDMTTGNISVTRDKSGVGVSGDKSYDVIEDRSTFEFRVGQADETTKGKKPPDEYDEGKAVFDQDGTVADIDEVDDATIKAIEDEIN